MAFEGLTEKLTATFKKLRGKGRLTENDVREAMREVRLALLEADVSYKVVKEFVSNVTERAVGTDVLDSLTPAQQVIKIVSDEMTRLMGGGEANLNLASQPPTVVMMVGLQGAGKTTNGAKLAGLMRRQYGKRPLLAACDVYRPAAIEQLRWWAPSWSCRYSSRARATPWPLPRRRCATPRTTATTSSFWTPPAGSTWTRS
jgi:signal recognition particle subunit SRP54